MVMEVLFAKKNINKTFIIIRKVLRNIEYCLVFQNNLNLNEAFD